MTDNQNGTSKTKMDKQRAQQFVALIAFVFCVIMTVFCYFALHGMNLVLVSGFLSFLLICCFLILLKVDGNT